MAFILDIADAVVTELKATEFSQAFTPVRTYTVEQALTALATLRVSVVPRNAESGLESRKDWRYEYQVDIGIQKKYSEVEAVTAERDALMTLAEEIADHFRAWVPDVAPHVCCVSVDNIPIYAPNHMKQGRVFITVVRLGFRTSRSLT